MALATKVNKKKKDIRQIRCYHCDQMGHYSSKCPEKKNVKEKTERDMAAIAVAEDYATKFEQEFSLVSIDSSVGISSFKNVWVVDSGATIHMTRVYDIF